MRVDFFESLSCGPLDPAQEFYFGGDGRPFRQPDSLMWPYDQPDYRTMTMAVVNWDNPVASRVITGSLIQPTHLYLGNELQETRTASLSGINVSDISAGSALVTMHWSHDVSNPFCGVGAIRYETDVRMYRNGAIEVVGWRRPAPNHEIYGRWNNTGLDFFGNISLMSSQGFHCLAPELCALETINRSVTH